MARAIRSNEIDATTGPILKKLIVYALPVIGVSLLQILFNSADVFVLSQFASDAAVAAVGSTTVIVNLFVVFFIGLSLATNVLVAKCKGANDREGAKRYVGTAMITALIFGISFSIIGVFCSKYFLVLTDCKESLFEMAERYLFIYCLGLPLVSLYNFCASILRAVGDTKRPFYYLLIGGVLNIILNVLFIVGFGKDVEGVAIATVASQGVSAILSIIACFRSQGFNALRLKYVKLNKYEFLQILKLGIPIALGKCMFSISNLVVLTGINSFSEDFITGNTIAHQFDVIIHEVCDAFASSIMTFVGQNLGTGNFQRIKKIVWTNLIIVAILGTALGLLFMVFGNFICGIMTDSEEVIKYGVLRLKTLGLTYGLTGIMNTFANTLRATGRATTATVISLICTCLYRVVWMNTVFIWHHTEMVLYLVYPTSWALCSIVFGITMLMHLKKLKIKFTVKNNGGNTEI